MTITASEREALERVREWLPILEARDLGIAEFHAMQLKMADDFRIILRIAERAAGEPVAHAYDPQAKCNRSVYNPTLGGIHRDCALQLGHTGDCRFQTTWLTTYAGENHGNKE